MAMNRLGMSGGMNQPMRALYNNGRPNTNGPGAAQTNAYRQQTEQANQDSQRYADERHASQVQNGLQSGAQDYRDSMAAMQGNTIHTNGMVMDVTNEGNEGGMAAARNRPAGGVAIGGSVFPDLSGLIAQWQSANQPHVPPPAHVNPPQVPSTSNAFAQAKNVAGRQGNKAMEAFHNMMTKRGMSDSGMAAEGDANILSNVARQQSEAEYNAANIDNTRQWESNEQGYQGDMAQNQMGYQGGIQQRGQDMQALLSFLQRFY